MFTSARRTTALSALSLSALLLSLGAGQALAADKAPRLDAASCEKPDFPTRWQDEGDRGDVTVAVLVDASGKVLNSKVLSSSGISRVDRASVKASSRCKFKAGLKDDKAVPSWAKVTYSWILE